jgi:aspartate-semialdehyde dehydrogenase
MTLSPIREFGIRRVFVTTYQALSGAGIPGPQSISMLGNIIPFIRNEEKKIVMETGKILGTVVDGRIENLDFPIYPSCARVPVRDGHLLSVNVELKRGISAQEAGKVFSSLPSEQGLPSSPEKPIIVLDDERRPQPVLDVMNGAPAVGMSVTIGRIRVDGNVLSYFALVNNTIRGGAGNAILTAELAMRKGLIGGGHR